MALQTTGYIVRVCDERPGVSRDTWYVGTFATPDAARREADRMESIAADDLTRECFVEPLYSRPE